MRKIFLFLFFIPVFAMAQTPNSGYLLTKPDGTVGIGITSPAASSLLDITSTTKGVLIPRMTTVQRDAIASPSTGLMIYNTTDSAFNFYRLSGWVSLNRGLSFTNGLTESGGTVKLGGALTQNTSLTNPSGYDLKLYVDEDDSFVGLVGINYNSLIGFEAGSIMIQHGSYNYFSNDGTQLQLYGGNGNNTSFINLTDDILRIDPAYGILSIDTLAAASNMTNKRVMTWDTVTKRWEQIAKDSVGGGGSDGYVDNVTFNTTTNYLTIEQTGAADVSVRIPPSYIINPINADSLTRIVNDSTLMVKAVVIADTDPVEVTTVRNDSLNTHTIAIRQTFLDSIRNGDFGGGSTSPAGNYGNLQINRNGAFATPGSDSLDFTTGLDIKGHVNVSATSTTGIQFGGTTRIYDDGSKMRISPSGAALQLYTAGVGNSLQVFNSAGSNSIVVDGQTGQIYRSSSGLQIQTTGNVGIGSGVGTTSTARLHISAGTATASSAPFKLTSGTNLTTPEEGAMEYNGTNLFFTPSSAARNNILMTASVNSVSPTSPNRTITVVVDGVTLYLHAKTTND